MSDNYCSGKEYPAFGKLIHCVPFSSCLQILDNINAPMNQTEICGFDTDINQVKICCPSSILQRSKVCRILQGVPKKRPHVVGIG